MRPEGLELHSRGSGPLHRADARLKLIAAVILVIAAVSVPMGDWRIFAGLGLILAFLTGLSGIPPWELATRWLGLLAAVTFLAITVAWAHPARPRLGLGFVVASILVRNGLALWTMLLLAGVTPFSRLLVALGRLGVPAVLTSTLQFMERYRHVLLDELDRMAVARRARDFSGRQSLAWSLLTGMIGLLFLRSFERAERVHDAMVARGWRGTVRNLDQTT
jgi:cobalt/nickel transport system permease protein